MLVLKEKAMVKKVISAAFISLIGLCILYFIASSVLKVDNRIAPDDVQALSINSITYKAEADYKEIAEFMKLFNDAKELKKSVDTTPAYLVEIRLKNEKRLLYREQARDFIMLMTVKGNTKYRV